MSRFAKSPHRIKRNNVLLNALPIDLTPSPIETQSELRPNSDVSNSLTNLPRSKSSLDQNSF